MRAATRRLPSICSAVPSPCPGRRSPTKAVVHPRRPQPTQEMGRAQSVLTDAVAEAERADDQVAAALASLGLLMIQASTRPSELSDSLGEAERLAASLERVGDEAGARLAQASPRLSCSTLDAPARRHNGPGPWSSSATGR